MIKLLRCRFSTGSSLIKSSIWTTDELPVEYLHLLDLMLDSINGRLICCGKTGPKTTIARRIQWNVLFIMPPTWHRRAYIHDSLQRYHNEYDCGRTWTYYTTRRCTQTGTDSLMWANYHTLIIQLHRFHLLWICCIQLLQKSATNRTDGGLSKTDGTINNDKILYRQQHPVCRRLIIILERTQFTLASSLRLLVKIAWLHGIEISVYSRIFCG